MHRSCVWSRFSTAGMIAVLAASAGGCNHAESPAAAHTTQNSTAVVQAVAPTRTTIVRTSTQPATIHAFHEAEIHARVAGYLAELNVDIGQQVKRGDVLGKIAIPEMELAYQKQEATIRQLQAEEQRGVAAVKLAAADVQSSEAAAVQAAADVGATVAQLTAAKSEFARVTDLVNSKSVAARLLDEARQKYESAASLKTSAEAALDSAKAAVMVAREGAAVAQADLAAAKAGTEVARKSLEEMSVMMSYATLKAPFDGTVTQRNVDPGDLVRNTDTTGSGSGRSLFVISHVDRLRVRIALPENDAALANAGDAVSLRVRSLPGRTIEGKISRVARRLDEATRTMQAEVDISNEEGLLLPGMYAEATVTLSETPNALTLSATAVRFDEAGNSSVCLIDENSSIKVVAVVTGYDDGKQIEIVNGLNDSSRVAAGTLGRLQDGQKVRVE